MIDRMDLGFEGTQPGFEGMIGRRAVWTTTHYVLDRLDILYSQHSTVEIVIGVFDSHVCMSCSRCGERVRATLAYPLSWHLHLDDTNINTSKSHILVHPPISPLPSRAALPSLPPPSLPPSGNTAPPPLPTLPRFTTPLHPSSHHLPLCLSPSVSPSVTPPEAAKPAQARASPSARPGN